MINFGRFMFLITNFLLLIGSLLSAFKIINETAMTPLIGLVLSMFVFYYAGEKWFKED